MSPTDMLIHAACGQPIATPLTMSSLEIAGLTGKRHDHVVRDIRAMLKALEAKGEGPFPQFWGKVASDGGRPLVVAYLPQRESLILVSGYSVELRARIIDRWAELERAIQSSTLGHPVTVADITEEVRRLMGGIMKSVVQSQIAGLLPVLLPDMVNAKLAEQTIAFRHGKTAGQLWRDFGLPRIKGIATWFGNLLAKMGCRIEGGGRGELGVTTARLFDPDKARAWFTDGGGRFIVEMKVKERQGQGRLRLVEKPVADFRNEERPL
jgi:hypothetical protein